MPESRLPKYSLAGPDGRRGGRQPSGLLREAHALDHGGEARVATDGIEAGIHFDVEEKRAAFRSGLLQPRERFVPVADDPVILDDHHGIYVHRAGKQRLQRRYDPPFSLSHMKPLCKPRARDSLTLRI